MLYWNSFLFTGLESSPLFPSGLCEIKSLNHTDRKNMGTLLKNKLGSVFIKNISSPKKSRFDFKTINRIKEYCLLYLIFKHVFHRLNGFNRNVKTEMGDLPGCF